MKNMKYWILSIFIFFSVCVLAQKQLNKYQITFTDKKNSPYSIHHPSLYLSQKSIKRREKQHLSVNRTDLPVNPRYIDSIKIPGVEVLSRSKWLNSILIQASDSIHFSTLLHFDFVKSIDTVYNYRFEKHKTKKSGTKSINKSKAVNYGKATRQIEMIDVDFLHRSGYKGKGKIIALLDAGFKNVNTMDVFQHLFDDNQIISTWDFVDNESNVYDDYSHGTNTFSCMAASSFGTAPEASYILLRSEDISTESLSEEIYWAAAAEYADSAGADIISSSLGYSTFDDSTSNHTYNDMDGKTTYITKAADIAAQKGMLVVVSAGNEGNKPWHYISAPADGDSVLTVGAVDKKEHTADFSSRGPTADGRIKPDVCALGERAAVYLPNGDVYLGNGTSFSTPIIAGASACLWQALPNKTGTEIRHIILKNANHYQHPNNDIGYGVPSFKKAYLKNTGITIKDKNKDQVIKMYPVPPQNELHFYYFSSLDQTLKIRLYDMNGKEFIHNDIEVYKNSIKNIDIPFANLAAGTYILKLQSMNSTKTFKIPYAKN